MPMRTGAPLLATDVSHCQAAAGRQADASTCATPYDGAEHGVISQSDSELQQSRIASVDLFVRESGPADAPVIVFLHGGRMSGWSWGPVVERMGRYRCLVPDLPQFGRSAARGPFEMVDAGAAVAELIRCRTDDGRAHVVGFSLGAQVGLQLLAAEPDLVDRAVLSGTVINTMPGVPVAQRVLAVLARTSLFRWSINAHWRAHHVGFAPAKTADYREDVRLMKGPLLEQIAMASAGFTLPEGLDKSSTRTLLVAGTEEMAFMRRWAASIAGQMPHGIDGVAIGMRHDWSLRYPELFSRTVDGWLSQTTLPSEIELL